MKAIVGVEPELRAAMVEVCRQVGPAASTLCDGWTAQDVVIHMNLIEGRWDSWGAVAIGKRVSRVQRVYDALVERERSRSWDDQLARLATGPRHNPLRTQWLRDRMMPREYLIHTEDIRRANGIDVAVSPDAQEVAWSRVGGLAKRMFLIDEPYGLELRHLDGRVITLKQGTPRATLVGAPLELLLHIFGRTSVTKVELTGDSDAVARAHVRDTSKFAQSLPRAFP
jgi:uncharacterized protein (TIGR03085 family)